MEDAEWTGGRVAARGYQYQYLRTLEQLIAVIDDEQVACVRVEGPSASEGAEDQVDFDVVELDGSLRSVVQVKSKVAGGTISGATALGILLDMVGGTQEARQYWLLTNGRRGALSDQLNDILSSQPEPSQLRGHLLKLFRAAPQRHRQLESLNEEQLARLARCRVAYDQRDDEEIRENLREALRALRNRARYGLGEQSAGLLTGYLISEILGRAADVTGNRASFPVEELRRLVLVDGETLACSIGFRDWGTLVGSIPTIPDVERPTLLVPLERAFEVVARQTVRRATLVGPSGIGKSSAAALFIAAHADGYDLIGWIDCETESSIRTSFDRVVAAVDPAAANTLRGGPIWALQQAVQDVLGRLAGRWLLVLDNVNSAREVERWVPKVGRGDVIATTLNGASQPGGGAVIAVPVMERDESVELLSRRLRLNDDERALWEAVLGRLAQALGDWPLALELGAGYLYGCDHGPEYVDSYLEELAVRSLSDEDSVPLGYPNTLAAALNLCIDRLEARIRPGVADLPTLALNMLYASAYLASHRIPGHLLLAAALTDIDSQESEHRGYFLVSPKLANLGETLRELNRFSLIKNDLPLPSTIGKSLPDADRTFAVNTVSQAMLRARLRAHYELPAALDRLLGHLERWLYWPLQLGELERVQAITPHAETLLFRIEQMRFSSTRVAHLYGNLAGSHHTQGDVLRAEALFNLELQHLGRLDPTNDVLLVQTRQSLALIYIQAQEIGGDLKANLTTTFQGAVEHLEFILQQARAWAFDAPKATLKLAIDSRIAIQYAHLPQAEAARLAPLALAFADLEGRIEPSTYSTSHRTIEQANQLIHQGQYAEAERCCRKLLDDGLVGPTAGEAQRFMIEALARQAKWREAIEEVRFWKLSAEGPRLFRHSVIDLLRNAGHACAEALKVGDMRSVALLSELIDWPDLDDFLAVGNDDDRFVIHAMRSLHESLQGN
ncbi:hypothetical protein [Kitasatospora sp. NPDC087315]|uniref:hypothetical protein n=1 Tax=Kitasatospora sp. NPDC087315 TaxID=3364069 RepID=UPI0038261473